MAVPAIELRPRGAVALSDAAIRLVSRSSGLWAVTLPGGALVTGALLNLTDAIQHRHAVLIPSALLAAAWFFRGLCQGAACYFVDRTLLGATEPTAWSAFREALRRMPSLLIAVGYLAVFNALTLVITLGLGFFFLSSHVAGYAVAIQGKGHPLALYPTCSKMLGAARGSALGVRILFGISLPLAMINLHLATNVATYLGRKLIGLDLTFAQRFTSLDNPVWVATVIAVGFALFEPARAAAASLLVVDGRVRQEGLDLLAAVEQLPVRRPKKPVLGQGAAAALLIALAAAIGFGSGPAWAQEKAGPARLGRAAARGAELRQRFAGVARRCGMSGEVLSRQLDAVDEVAATEHSSLTRLLDDVESFAFDDGNCENARARLRQALPLVVQARDEMRARKAQTETAAQRAQRILARPEFAVDPEKVAQAPEPEKPPSEAPGWWRSFVEWLERVLNKLGPDHGPTVSLPSGGAFSANILVVVVVAGVVIALTYLLISGRRKTAGINEGLEISTTAETGLAADPQSALSRLPEGWAGLADELASRGEFREAVRSLYLALLSKLHRLGAIDYDPAYSNWDYFRGFKGRREWLPPFRELTSRFDFAYYGHLPVDSQGYHAFRTLTQPLLTADSNAEPVGA